MSEDHARGPRVVGHWLELNAGVPLPEGIEAAITSSEQRRIVFSTP